MATARWQSFFQDAGIPKGPAEGYAVIFSDNRMRMDMLNELNKGILVDLGINVMGDVIAILRHSKAVYAQISRSAAEEFDVNKTKKSEERGKSSISDTKPKLAVEKSRTKPEKEPLESTKKQIENVNKILDLAAVSKAKKAPKSLSSRFGEYDVTTNKKRNKEKDEVITISIPVTEPKSQEVPMKKKRPLPKEKKAGPTQKKTVFDRLGASPSDEVKPAVDKLGSSEKESKVSSVFSRLGESTNVKQGTSRLFDSARAMETAASDRLLTATIEKGKSVRLGLGESQSVLRPIKHVKPIPRKPLAMDMEPVRQAKQVKGTTEARSKSKAVKTSEMVSKSVFDRLGT